MADIEKNETTAQSGVSRRQFIAGVGGVGVGAVLGGALLKGILLPDEVLAVPASEGYLLVDTKKCSGCQTCMLTCALTHYGRQNSTLSRIQIINNPFGKFPTDMAQFQCRQCPYPSCVAACPTGAMHADPETGVRLVDEALCIGCERCIEACPFTPSRVQWNHEDRHAQKCDLCMETPFWNEEGGVDGKQACVEMCPMHAISYTDDLPKQTDEGYDVNLRNQHWGNLGFPTDDLGEVLPGASDTPSASH